MTRGQSFSVSFPPPERIWGTNDERQMHHMARAALVRIWKDATRVYWQQQTSRARNVGPSLIRISLPFPEERLRDPSNYCGGVCKAIIDGLVLAGAWPDDNPLYLTHFEPLLVAGKKLVVVDIRPRTTDWETLFS